MIPELIIQAWQNSYAPWNSPTMVEQDLIISRALVNLYQQNDMTYLLHPNIGYDFHQACDLILDTLASKLPGDPWKT